MTEPLSGDCRPSLNKPTCWTRWGAPGWFQAILISGHSTTVTCFSPASYREHPSLSDSYEQVFYCASIEHTCRNGSVHHRRQASCHMMMKLKELQSYMGLRLECISLKFLASPSSKTMYALDPKTLCARTCQRSSITMPRLVGLGLRTPFGGSKEFSIFCMCFVCHTLERSICKHDFIVKVFESEMVLILLDWAALSSTLSLGRRRWYDRMMKLAKVAFSGLTLLVGLRKGIRLVKNVSGGMLAWLSGMRCRLAYSPADATATHYLLLQ